MERTMTAMQGGTPDRHPVFAVMGSYASRLTNIPIKDLYQKSECWVHAQQAVINQLGIDLLLGFFEHSMIAEIFGGTVAFFDHQAPNLKKPGYHEIDAFLRSPIPDPLKDGRYPMALENVRQLRSIYGDTVPIVVALPGFTALPVMVFGLEKWLETLLFEYKLACDILDKLMPFWKKLLKAVFANGIHFAVLTEGLCTSNIVTRDLYEEKMHRFVQHSYRESPGPLIFHHTGGSITHIMELIPSLSNLGGVSISSEDSISQAREKLGHGIPILGNLDNLIFPRNPPVMVKAATKLVCMEGHDNPPFILCNSGGDIHIESSIECIRAFIDTGKGFHMKPTAS